MHKPVRVRTYRGIVVGLFSFATFFFAGGVFSLACMLKGAPIGGVPGSLFVCWAMLTILGFVFALAGRNLDQIRELHAGADDGETTRPIIQARQVERHWIGVTGRRYGTVPMPVQRADTTLYGNGPATEEQSAVKADASELSLARVRRLGKWVSNAAPTR